MVCECCWISCSKLSFSTRTRREHGLKKIKIISLFFSFNNSFSQTEPSHLVATLLPKTSHFLPRVRARNLDYFLSYECFRLACELLYGQVPCYAQYSDVVPKDEFADEDVDMVATLVSKTSQ